MQQPSSIFQQYYSSEPFRDRFATDSDGAIDVLIPVLHTNELWRSNLISLYREIPINRLLIGDGGCKDDSVEIAASFPRVEVFDHTSYKTLGYSIRRLIEEVQTEWFVYVHADVYLPDRWFDAMRRHQDEYDWFGCPQQVTALVQFEERYEEKPWAGSQMGRRRAFDDHLARIDDDYVYRQEDFVFVDVIERGGFKEGRIDDTFHFHQLMHKPSPWARTVKSFRIDTEATPEEEERTWSMQAKGIVKYLQPTKPWLVNEFRQSVARLEALGTDSNADLRDWIAEINPVWLPYLQHKAPFKHRLSDFLRASYRLFFG